MALGTAEVAWNTAKTVGQTTAATVLHRLSDWRPSETLLTVRCVDVLCTLSLGLCRGCVSGVHACLCPIGITPVGALLFCDTELRLTPCIERAVSVSLVPKKPSRPALLGLSDDPLQPRFPPPATNLFAFAFLRSIFSGFLA